MLSLAGANPRDYAVLQVFLQTGIRVSELANLTIDAVDLFKPCIKVVGKGKVEREIELEKKDYRRSKATLRSDHRVCPTTSFKLYGRTHLRAGD